MSLFPIAAASDFGPLFRLLDDYDTHRTGRGTQQAVRAFQPKFDIRETKEAYELHGELPGIDQKDVSIEFSDPTTLVIKGRVEREYSTGGPEQGRITGDVSDQSQSHKATVEDESQEGQSQQQVQQQQQGEQQVSKKGHQHHKYWVTERSVGEFYRSFSFPSRVDQDNVKASLKNGILNIHVPKAAAHQAKKINID
jgi:HSP20 family molecular chaperone IbpA